MLLDSTTLVAASTCITGLLGIFLLVVWIQERSVNAMAWWGCAYLVGSAAVALWGFQPATRGIVAEIPNMLLFTACGMIWNGARLFHGRRVLPSALLAGAWLWFVADQFNVLPHIGNGRIVLSSLIIAIYTFLAAMELRRERRRALRWLAVGAPVLHSMVFLS